MTLKLCVIDDETLPFTNDICVAGPAYEIVRPAVLAICGAGALWVPSTRTESSADWPTGSFAGSIVAVTVTARAAPALHATTSAMAARSLTSRLAARRRGR